MNTIVTVELDRWGDRGAMRAKRLEDGSQIYIGIRNDGNKKIVLDRTIQLDRYFFRVFITEYRGETFFLRATMGIKSNTRRKRDGNLLRERPLKPFYDDAAILRWPIDRTGVFEKYPAPWDDLWAYYFIRETLDYLRSPEAPEHCELHSDNSELENEY